MLAFTLFCQGFVLKNATKLELQQESHARYTQPTQAYE